MGTLKSPSRRTFLKSGAAVGGSLVIGFTIPETFKAAQAASASSPVNAWVRVGADNSVTILCARSEMGQGVVMSMPTLVAEELDVDLYKVKVEFAPPGEVYINGMLGGQITGGSTSVRDGWEKLRIAGAQARTMLIAAAAQEWEVDAAQCHARNGWIYGPKNKKTSYGKVAAAASKLTPP
ncbi:MAG TPA: molybdopterin cofactor-binding domain-containing protein, partial [Burkholderiales bacterium]|nr:molybdopterin cofactor-binding domain-containing protein [Burkholderiales bacterium]